MLSAARIFPSTKLGQLSPLVIEPWLTSVLTHEFPRSKKQGAYGRVPTIKAGKLEQLSHIDEVIFFVSCDGSGCFMYNKKCVCSVQSA